MPLGVLLGLVLVTGALGVALAADHKTKAHRSSDRPVSARPIARRATEPAVETPLGRDSGALITPRSIGVAAQLLMMLVFTIGSAFFVSIGEVFALDQCDTRCNRVAPAAFANFFGQFALVAACALVAWLVPRLRRHAFWLTITASVVLSIVTLSVAQSAMV